MTITTDPIISAAIGTIITGATQIPLSVSAGDTVSGTLGETTDPRRGGSVVNDTDDFSLQTTAGETYTVVVTDPDYAGYQFVIGGEQVTPAYNSVTSTYTYAFTATSSTTSFNLFDDGDLAPNDYTLSFNAITPPLLPLKATTQVSAPSTVMLCA